MRLTMSLLKKAAKKLYQGRGEEFTYWKKYIFWEKMRHITGPDIWRPLTGWQVQSDMEWYYTDQPAYTRSNLELQNISVKQIPESVPMKTQEIFLGDKVQVLVGPDKGKMGEVIQIVPERGWCFVESLHLEYTRHEPDEENYERSYMVHEMEAKEKPLLLRSEVKLIDPADYEVTDIDWRYQEDGTRIRVSMRTGRIIPLPGKHRWTWDDHTESTKYAEREKDTKEKDLEAVTYKPSTLRFEEDICKTMGIEYTPRKKRGFTY